MKTDVKADLKSERQRMFAPFIDAEHYNKFHNAVMNGIPEKHHWDIMILMQQTISTWHENPELAKELWK